MQPHFDCPPFLFRVLFDKCLLIRRVEELRIVQPSALDGQLVGTMTMTTFRKLMIATALAGSFLVGATSVSLAQNLGNIEPDDFAGTGRPNSTSASLPATILDQLNAAAPNSQVLATAAATLAQSNPSLAAAIAARAALVNPDAAAAITTAVVAAVPNSAATIAGSVSLAAPNAAPQVAAAATRVAPNATLQIAAIVGRVVRNSDDPAVRDSANQIALQVSRAAAEVAAPTDTGTIAATVGLASGKGIGSVVAFLTTETGDSSILTQAMRGAPDASMANMVAESTFSESETAKEVAETQQSDAPTVVTNTTNTNFGSTNTIISTTETEPTSEDTQSPN